MPKQKCKCPEGVADWVVTYGDMMSLLLCFFILLAAFSEPKQDREFQEVVQAIKEQFGYTGGAGLAPSRESPKNSIISMLENVSLHKSIHQEVSNADDPGVTGKQTTVKRVREGQQVVVGGPVPFERASSELSAATRKQLDRIADTLRGKNNKVEIRGHAGVDDIPDDAAEAAFWQLSQDRAKAVKDYLTDPRRGIRAERVRMVACAHHEPLDSRAYNPLKQANNRRVEIIEIEALVNDFADNQSAKPIEAATPSGR